MKRLGGEYRRSWRGGRNEWGGREGLGRREGVLKEGGGASMQRRCNIATWLHATNIPSVL